jgi:hypothetical protein
MKTQQPSNWLRMSDALKTLAAGFEKVDEVERNGGFTLPSISAVPALNGKANGHTNGHSNGHAAAKALPAPQKVRKAPKAAVKALPAPAEAKPAKATKAIVKAKAEKPAKAKPAKTKAAPANAIAAGRRAVTEGLRPKLVDAVAIVMGDETLSAGDILERLKERGWAPGASAKQAYISYTLSDNEEIFKRVKRGEYAVIKPKNYVDLAAQWKSGKAPKAAAATKEAAPKAAKAAPKAKPAKAKGSKTSGKAEGVASTDAGETEVLAVAAEPEVAQAAAVETEVQPVAGDPPTTTSDATASASVDTALEDLGLGQEVSGNPFDALS